MPNFVKLTKLGSRVATGKGEIGNTNYSDEILSLLNYLEDEGPSVIEWDIAPQFFEDDTFKALEAMDLMENLGLVITWSEDRQ